MEQAPRYASLSDYLRVIRRRWYFVVVATILVGAAALLVSLSQEPRYEATAQISFRDIAADLDLVSGSASAPDILAPTRAATNAELITRPQITTKVQKKLKSNLSDTELASAISTRVGIQTNLVILTASADEARLAANIANAYAQEAKKLGTKEAQSLLDTLEERAEDDLKEAQDQRRPDALRVGNIQDRLSRIRTLSDVTKPVEVVSSALEPSTPVSPRPARNTILGVLLGATLGLMIAFVRDSLDRRIHTAQDAHHEIGIPILGHVSQDALGHPGLATRDHAPMDESDFEAFRILRTNLRALSDADSVRSILVTSGRPDEGKTAVSLSLASACAIAGQRVLLLECDLRKPSFTKRLGLKQEPGLTEYLTGDAGPQRILQEVRLSEPTGAGGSDKKTNGAAGTAGSLVCITSGKGVANPAELLGGERFEDLLRKVSIAYDVVVIDSSPLLAVVDPLELVSRVDLVLICMRAGKTTRDEARATRAALGHLPDRPTGGVLTGLKRGGVDGYGYYYGY